MHQESKAGSQLLEKESGAPSVYAVIVNWNGERDTIKCLESLLHASYQNLHVVISDNGSREASLCALQSWIDSRPVGTDASAIRTCTILRNYRNLGFTGANTAGINFALTHNADYILFLNNDTIVTPDFLNIMVRAAESDPKIGIVGCKIFYTEAEPNGRHRLWSLGGYSFHLGMPINLGSEQYDRPEWKGVRQQDLINGCCMLLKRAMIDIAGVQDDLLFFGIDDVEYSFRASKYGWKNVVARDAVIYHSASRSVVSRSGLQVYYLFRNVLYFRFRNFLWYQNLLFLSVFAFRYLFLGCLYRLLMGQHSINRGVYLAMRDFWAGRMGECGHEELCCPDRKSHHR